MKKYEEFGLKLKFYRSRHQESISQVAEAIDVDRTYLSKLENGHERPTEAMINLLTNHFALSIVEALELSLAAGYTGRTIAGETKEVNMNDPNQTGAQKGLEIKVPDNVQVLYSDSVWVTRSPWGVVFDFAQGMGPTNHQNVVSRIGMSIDHARALKDLLTKKIAEEDSKKQ